MTVNPNQITDEYDALGGHTLVRHFQEMDRMLWKSLNLVVQDNPGYVQQCTALPLIRSMTGSANGRRWFIDDPSGEKMSQLLEITRLWVQGEIEWHKFILGLKHMTLYRDTLRGWVENAEVSNCQVKEHVDNYYKTYLVLRDSVTTSYLPMVWKTASSHGFTREAQDDLFQIGTTGLIHATERYNNNGPMTFPRFAYRWIKQAVLLYISRRMSLIKVSHSVLGDESRLLRDEMLSGKRDTSQRAERIRRSSSSKDVVLSDQLDAEKEEENNLVDLTLLPRELRQAVILKYGLLEHAQCNMDEDLLKQERQYQNCKEMEQH